MLGGLLTMSAKELDREGRLPQKQAATMMGMTARQVRRLCQAYEAAGPAGLVSRKRGKPSNRRSSEAVRSRALALVRELYADFGPTLACEKLVELHDVRGSRETLRTWMKADGLWLTRRDRIPRPTFHAAEMQRMKEYNEAADELAAAVGPERELGQ